ncbi:unnamed protein product [Ostreobium quekettii]|uniref:Peptidase S1 domain-containing protein n=1 Tax=Ostreobium quekettii TaxID=121088 RepID=A0A8S1IVA8_9CHLO|nr:unnamed protein product [Ostreobium quekettii]
MRNPAVEAMALFSWMICMLVVVHGVLAASTLLSTAAHYPKENDVSCYSEASDKNPWRPAPQNRFPWFVSIRGRSREHLCAGMLVEKRYVLSSAYCIDIVGPNPILVVSPTGLMDDRWTPGVQEIRAETAIIHPQWTGKVEHGHDVALLRLPRPLDIATPRLASVKSRSQDGKPEVQPNAIVYSFRLGHVLEVAQFKVVARASCPNLTSLSTDSFCIHSKVASGCEGCSGGPVIVPDTPLHQDCTSNASQGYHEIDLVVGIVSCANFSALETSGVGCILISEIGDWLDSIIPSRKPQWTSDTHLVVLSAIMVIALVMAFIATRDIPPWASVVFWLLEIALVVCMVTLWVYMSEDLGTPNERLAEAFAQISATMGHGWQLLLRTLITVEPQLIPKMATPYHDDVCQHHWLICQAQQFMKRHNLEMSPLNISICLFITAILMMFIVRIMGYRPQTPTAPSSFEHNHIPLRLGHFIQRNSLCNEIVDALTESQGSGAVPHVSIEGMAGLGKTTLAIEIAREARCCDHFKDGVFWLHVRVLRLPASRGTVAILGMLHDQLLEAFSTWWTSGRNRSRWGEDAYVAAIQRLVGKRKVLVVVDGLQHKEFVRPLLRIGCPLLVTTQLSNLFVGTDGAKAVRLQPLNDDQSHELFITISEALEKRPTIESFLEECGGHPLALVIIGAALRQRIKDRGDDGDGRDVAEMLLDRISDPVSKLALRIPNVGLLHPADQERHLSLMRCKDIELDNLSEHERSCYIALKALTDYQCITADGVSQLWDMPDQEEALQMLHTLEGRCLLEGVKDSKGTIKSWKLHRLQHDHLAAIEAQQPHYRTVINAAAHRQGKPRKKEKKKV